MAAEVAVVALRRRKTWKMGEEAEAAGEAPPLPRPQEWRRGPAAVEAGGSLDWAGAGAGVGPTCPTGRGVAGEEPRQEPWRGAAAAGRLAPGTVAEAGGRSCGVGVGEEGRPWRAEEAELVCGTRS